MLRLDTLAMPPACAAEGGFSFYLPSTAGDNALAQTPAEAYAAEIGPGQPVDMMDKAFALPTSTQAQQQHSNMIKELWPCSQQSQYTLAEPPSCPIRWNFLNCHQVDAAVIWEVL
jgi:hypothetical protein